MEAIIAYLKRLFATMFRSSANRYKRNLEGAVRRQTVGKVQAKMAQGRQKMDKAVFGAQDKVLGKGKPAPRGPGNDPNKGQGT